ncbi:MAG: hypothetical protein RL088_4205 [Verrucomicrobiota bacterium]|jgi:hypothetical protein
MRALIFATFACPLFIGMAIAVSSADQSFGDGQFFDEYAGSVLLGCAVFTIISLFAVSRPQPSESAFAWLFFFGLFCLGLSLAEIYSDWGRTPYGIEEFRAMSSMTRILFLTVTLLFGLAHIIAALVRDHLHPRLTSLQRRGMHRQ